MSNTYTGDSNYINTGWKTVEIKRYTDENNPQGDSALAIRIKVLTFPQTGVNVFERAKEDPSGIFLQDDFFFLIFKIPHLKQELFIRGLKNSIEGRELALHTSNLSLIPSIPAFEPTRGEYRARSNL